MTYPIDTDSIKNPEQKNQNSLFPSSDFETSGIRTTRAEFSRLMECSKQAVTDWVKSGRIVVGADGRFDPSKAVRSLLATGDPAKIRARVLAPLIAEQNQLRDRITRLEKDLAEEKEMVEFHEGACKEMTANWEALNFQLYTGWSDIRRLNAEKAHQVISIWMKQCFERGSATAGNFQDHLAKLLEVPEMEMPLPKIEDLGETDLPLSNDAQPGVTA